MEDYTPEQQASMEAEAISRIEQSEQVAREQSGEVEPNLDNYKEQTTTEPILGKFKSQDDLIKAYQELEKRFSTPQQETQPTHTEEVAKEEVPTVEDDTTVNPNDLSEFITDYASNGKLSEASYSKLKEMGISKQIADAYIQGQKALLDTTIAKTYESVGGKENYDGMINWAKETLNDSQKAAFNKALATGDADVMSFAIDGLYSKYSQANRTPTRIKGEAIAPTATNVYENRIEYMKATGNRLYGSDAKYTANVDQKYLRSLNAGTL